MEDKKVLMMTRVKTNWKSIDEFNEYWGRTNLPFWTENGAKHLGSFVNHVGAARNEIVRLFQFENLSTWNAFMELRESLFQSEEGKKAFQTTIGFVEQIEETIWISVY